MYSLDNNVINICGIIIWVILYPLLVPTRYFKEHPVMLIGFFYTIIILVVNILLNGGYTGKNKKSDFNKKSTLKILDLINTKAVQVSTAIFALAISTKEIFPFYKDVLILLIYTLLFGVGVIIPIYFITNQKKQNTISKHNELLARVRNVSLSYSVGFMVSGFVFVISNLYKRKK
tara:strand:+ start:4524 stop:5048 length:525 start_codon:yes stop_codon:yes gene_type:complete